MFRYKLQENTRIYLKTLLVEDDAPSKKKGSKKGKAKKEDAPVKTDDTPVDGGKPVSPVSDAVVVVDPAKTSLTPEEQKIKEAEQKEAQKKEQRERTIQPNRDLDKQPDKDYIERIKSTTGGPSTEYAFSPFDLSTSGRGRGAPFPAGEDVFDRTGIQKSFKQSSNYLYNFPVLFGQSEKDIVDTSSGQPSANKIFEPYKDLQRIKLLKAVSPSILQKALAVKNVESIGQPLAQGSTLVSGMAQASLPAGSSSSLTTVSGTVPNNNRKGQEDELIKAGILPKDKNLTAAYDDSIINAIYQTASQKKTSKTSNDIMDMVKNYTGKLSGMGGLDPLFAEELSAKLLGGEWIEKAMQNIAPAQEKGVISSMGNRKSIGM